MLGEGQQFAGYTIERQLGAGGMGEVYLARHPRLPRRDALKILRPELSTDPDFRARFIREADLAAALTHPHIVTVHDRGEYDGQLWIATAYIDGTDAAHLLRARYPAGMPTDEATTITTAIAAALDYAHDRGLLHRDVKPANILLSHPDHTGQRQIYLADFGIARPLTDPNGLTATNTTLGTFNYAAPEQLTGDTLDGRADQYALAATTYQLLTGTPPFTSATNPIAVISQHLNTPPPPVSRHRPELTNLDPILTKALAKNPADRYPTCTAFATQLAQDKPLPPAEGWTAAAMTAAAIPPVPQTLPPSGTAEEPTPTRKRLNPLLWAGLAGSIAAAAAAALLWAQQRDPVASPQPTDTPPPATITATPRPETVTKTIAPNPPKPTQTDLNLPPDQWGAVLFQTPSGRTACDVRADTVSCGVDFTIATPTLYGSCPANGITLRPDGSWDWVCGNIGGKRVFRPLTYGIPYRAIDWRILVTTEGTTFTNLKTGRGLTISAEGIRAP